MSLPTPVSQQQPVGEPPVITIDIPAVINALDLPPSFQPPLPSPPLLLEFPVPSHRVPRFSCFVESKVSGSAVMISCKSHIDEMIAVKHYRDLMAEAMFHCALNQRFLKIYYQKDLPYFSCSSIADALVCLIKAYIMTSKCRENGTIEALESMLMEVARVRVPGFSERGISVMHSLMMSEIESAYLEHDQMQSISLRDEYLQHFFHNEPVAGIEYEAKLQKKPSSHGFFDAVDLILRNNVDKRTALENLDLILLCFDEIVD